MPSTVTKGEIKKIDACSFKTKKQYQLKTIIDWHHHFKNGK